MNPDLVRDARALGMTRILLVADDLTQTRSPDEARSGQEDLHAMVRLALDAPEYRRRLGDWTAGRTSTIALRDLFDEAHPDLPGYWKDLGVSNRVDRIDSASLHARGHAEELSRMEDIRRLAVELGAPFSEIREDTGLEASYDFCANAVMMSPIELRRYDEAVADRNEDLAESHGHPEP